ncbi:MAG: 2-oxoacid:acceptor oxidoreductase family protein [Firmicutes bacterium]|nr:2-oxoacid:acceptor oxidoreductase family protein [Bacillota bacterium]
MKNKQEKMIIAGFGGQGVLSLGQFIGLAAISGGKEVTWLPSYGPEMRGGTSNCSVVVSDTMIASPIITAPDVVIAMNKPSVNKFLPRVKAGGVIIINSSLVEEKANRSDIKVIYLKANELAEEAGDIKTANIVALGAYLKNTDAITREQAESVIKQRFSDKPKLVTANLKALELGFANS